MTKKTPKHAYIKSYEYIRDKILNGELPRGTKLTEERIAEELGVSRTPVREAIRKLEQEGLILQKKVVNPTDSDLRNIFQVRILLEGYAARYSATYMSEESLEELWKCIVTARTGTTEEIMEANEKFHNIIVQTSNNPFMIDIIDRMQSIIYLFRKTVVYYKRPFLIDEHEQIYKAIYHHDGDEAERLMKEHLQKDLDFCLHYFQQ
ncbi:GntR family transcriptional regulator [Aeribacillus composti]|uniref:GntR family transcriptional regulator n=1 Tax=Aeribacillus composti TaxID=1868734 RepID=A0ABY9WDZ7_9BACI|nr:GntR family transcriptional regulator [Aeribacillus composti]REJ27308.1 MAG: GntR family transcriptional regulator [Bacillaceae bacterium]BBU38931.1 GntR family transcriptional regulator [Aeribacillus pallidus]MED1438154.1 GntR family transcriptional regulator [Aeribacillus composti]TVZ84274.1 DNA-binding GntR family transcriptional regulator [Aeribacillus composti]WNF34248.1 GntR family transcriptional regulator [Aeribacillus composti]